MTDQGTDPGADRPIRIGLVDDQPMFTAGVAMVVRSQPDMEVAWQAVNGQLAVDSNRNDPVDVILMDIQMPVLDGISATGQIAESDRAETKVVMLTTFDTEDHVADAIASGASGFLLKDAEPEDVLGAIRTVHGGDAVISARSTKRLLQRVRPILGVDQPPAQQGAELPPAMRASLDAMTPREVEILTAMAKGWSNTEIAQRFFVSMPTVKTHVGHVLAKTHSRDRVHAVLFAFQCGLISREDLLGVR